MSKQIILVVAAALLVFTGVMMMMEKKSEKQLTQMILPEQLVMQFNDYISIYNKSYGDMYDYRLHVFAKNVAEINRHNADPTQSYKKGINQFTDMSADEFKLKMLMRIPPPNVKSTQLPEDYFNDQIESDGEPHPHPKPTPKSVNWVTKGAVTPIKNQGQCGSCWAFSTTGVLEGTSKIQAGSLQSFSEQQLVDCCGPSGFGCQGCNGAWPEDALNYVKAKGITTEAAYPYVGVQGTCKTQGGNYHITSYTMLAAGSTTALTAGIVKEPISICVDASNWSSYSSGIYPAAHCSSSSGSLDHAVLAVGYTSTYWLVKNSWGTSWGMAGYIELARPGNTCGLADHAISVTH